MPIKGYLNWLWLMAWRPVRTALRQWLCLPEMEAAHSLEARTNRLVSGTEDFMVQLQATYPRLPELLSQIGLFFQANEKPNGIRIVSHDPATGELIECTFRRRHGVSVDEMNDNLRAALEAILYSDPSEMAKIGLNAQTVAMMALVMCGHGFNSGNELSVPPVLTQVQRLEARSISSKLHEFMVAYGMYLLKQQAEQQRNGNYR
jgi:hypothetical protein